MTLKQRIGVTLIIFNMFAAMALASGFSGYVLVEYLGVIGPNRNVSIAVFLVSVGTIIVVSLLSPEGKAVLLRSSLVASVYLSSVMLGLCSGAVWIRGLITGAFLLVPGSILLVCLVVFLIITRVSKKVADKDASVKNGKS